MDLHWISAEAKTIHDFFVSIFYTLATVLLLIGIITEYFKFPLGGAPAFSQLIGRALVAGILLAAYPEISNTIATVADAIAEKLGSLNTFHEVLKSAGSAVENHSKSWTSLTDSLLALVSYGAYAILYVTVFFFDAAIVYCLVLCYVFSPLMIAFYILPQTAGMTKGLFRTVCEIATWKIVWSVLGTLLWSTALNNFKNGGEGNFITMLALTLMLAFSIMLTPLVVKSLIGGAIAGIAAQTAGLAAMGLSAGLLSPAALAGLAKAGTKKATLGTAKFIGNKVAKTYQATRGRSRPLPMSSFVRKFPSSPSKTDDDKP
jgi:hypothetical protein